MRRQIELFCNLFVGKPFNNFHNDLFFTGTEFLPGFSRFFRIAQFYDLPFDLLGGVINRDNLVIRFKYRGFSQRAEQRHVADSAELCSLLHLTDRVVTREGRVNDQHIGLVPAKQKYQLGYIGDLGNIYIQFPDLFQHLDQPAANDYRRFGQCNVDLLVHFLRRLCSSWDMTGTRRLSSM
jgi:hypothetical protein